MANPDNLQDLTALFRRLGAPSPESWARSQMKEGIGQLHRYLFLRQAWSNVISEDDLGWIDREVKSGRGNANAPYAGVGQALARLLASGASRDDLTDLVRGMQAQLLFGICYLLDDPSLREAELRDFGWCLVEAGENFEPTSKVIGALHESVLQTDPTGREMRPRRAP